MQINPAEERELILVVEDDENDAFFVQKAFEKAAVENPLRFVSTGRDAMSELNENVPIPT